MIPTHDNTKATQLDMDKGKGDNNICKMKDTPQAAKVGVDDLSPQTPDMLHLPLKEYMDIVKYCLSSITKQFVFHFKGYW